MPILVPVSGRNSIFDGDGYDPISKNPKCIADEMHPSAHSSGVLSAKNTEQA
jgi:hypothetical protein